MMTLVNRSLLQRGCFRYLDRFRLGSSDACRKRPPDKATRCERQACDDENDSAGTRDGRDGLAGPSAQLTGVSKARPLAHLLPQVVVGVGFPTYDFASIDFQRQL